jgi:hypothetical protein
MVNSNNFEFNNLPIFNKLIKKLKKRFHLVETDLDTFKQSISSEEDLGISLGNNLYKARLSNSNKNRGKSAGYRLITYFKIKNNSIYLCYIYDKSDLENLSEKEIDTLIIKSLQDI